LQITHTCQSCNAILRVCFHESWQAVKDCDAVNKALCQECAAWPGSGCPSVEAADAGRENHHE
jgi:hypothetical protein